MKKIKNISHARIAEHMKQLKNAELPEHAGTAEHFRNEWKYLISTSEKELLELRMKHLLKKDPHASDGSYMIRRACTLMIIGTVLMRRKNPAY